MNAEQVLNAFETLEQEHVVHHRPPAGTTYLFARNDIKNKSRQ